LREFARNTLELELGRRMHRVFSTLLNISMFQDMKAVFDRWLGTFHRGCDLVQRCAGPQP
jgi:hypothetical protein